MYAPFCFECGVARDLQICLLFILDCQVLVEHFLGVRAYEDLVVLVHAPELAVLVEDEDETDNAEIEDEAVYFVFEEDYHVKVAI